MPDWKSLNLSKGGGVRLTWCDCICKFWIELTPEKRLGHEPLAILLLQTYGGCPHSVFVCGTGLEIKKNPVAIL